MWAEIFNTLFVIFPGNIKRDSSVLSGPWAPLVQTPKTIDN